MFLSLCRLSNHTESLGSPQRWKFICDESMLLLIVVSPRGPCGIGRGLPSPLLPAVSQMWHRQHSFFPRGLLPAVPKPAGPCGPQPSLTQPSCSCPRSTLGAAPQGHCKRACRVFPELSYTQMVRSVICVWRAFKPKYLWNAAVNMSLLWVMSVFSLFKSTCSWGGRASSHLF